MVSEEFLRDNRDLDVTVGNDDEDTSAGAGSPGGIDAPTLDDDTGSDPGFDPRPPSLVDRSPTDTRDQTEPGSRGSSGGGSGGSSGGRSESSRTVRGTVDLSAGMGAPGGIDAPDVSGTTPVDTVARQNLGSDPVQAEPTSISGSGTIASIDIPGTDRDLGGVLDQGARGFERRITDPLGDAARETNEAGTPFTAGSEGRGQLAEDFIESAAGAANVPAAAAAGVRVVDEVSRQFEPAFPGGPLVPTGDPERTEQTATAAREAGEAGAEFAAENPGRTAAIGAGALAGGLGAGAASRGARVGVRGARNVELPDSPTTGGRGSRGLDDFLADERGQLDGSLGRSGTDDGPLTIGGDDIAGRSDLPDRRIESPDPDRPTQRPETTGFDEGDFNARSGSPRRSDAPDRFDRGETAAEANPSYDARATFEPSDATVPRDPLNTAGGRTPTGAEIAAGGLGIGLGTEASGFLDQAQRSTQRQTGATEPTFDPTRDGLGGVTVDNISVTDTGSGTDTGTDRGTDTGSATLTGTETLTGTTGLLAGVQVTGTRSGADETGRPPTSGDPTRGGFSGFNGGPPTFTPRPDIPGLDPAESDDEETFQLGEDDDVFASGIQSAEDILSTNNQMRAAMDDVFPGAPDSFEGNRDGDPFALDEASIYRG